ncbi:hypothetical protein ACN6LI_004879, partial [Streptomyces violaceoruber]
AERADLGLTDEPRLAEAAGLRFVALPVPDFTVPSVPAVLPPLRELTEGCGREPMSSRTAAAASAGPP